MSERLLYRYELKADIIWRDGGTYAQGYDVKVHVNASDFDEAKKEARERLNPLNNSFDWRIRPLEITYLGVRVEPTETKKYTGTAHFGTV